MYKPYAFVFILLLFINSVLSLLYSQFPFHVLLTELNFIKLCSHWYFNSLITVDLLFSKLRHDPL